MVQGPDIVELDTSSDEDSLSGEGLRSPRHAEDRCHAVRDRENDASQTKIDRAVASELCFQEVTEVFPDISLDYLREIYESHINSDEFNATHDTGTSQTLIEKILDSSNYPKERHRRKEANQLKRKRESQGGDAEEAKRWKSEDLISKTWDYTKISQKALQEDFPLVPAKYIDSQFKEQGYFYGAHVAIAKAEREYDDIAQKPYVKLKSRRYCAGLCSEDSMVHMTREGHKYDMLKEEIEASRQRRKRDNNKRVEQNRAAAEIVAKEQAERRNGDVMECACCFDDATISTITHCNGEIPHFFCFDCARMNADNDIGVNKYGLQCMDGSVCKSTFSRAERAKFLDVKIVEKLEDLEQQAAIRAAMEDLPDFVTCPFCHYGHICPPIEEDKEFRCGFVDCKEVTCPKIIRSHVPLSCDEHRKENGINERHLIEEARTEALIRTCPKLICDYCGQDITQMKYNHFEGQVPFPDGEVGGKKCPLYDKTKTRKDEQIAEAGKAAIEKIQKENPDLSEEDLRIKFSKEVETQDNVGQPHHHHHHHYLHARVQPPPPVPRYEVLPERDMQQRNVADPVGGNPFYNAGLNEVDYWTQHVRAFQPANPPNLRPLQYFPQARFNPMPVHNVGERPYGNDIQPQLDIHRARDRTLIPDIHGLQEQLKQTKARFEEHAPAREELQRQFDRTAARLRQHGGPLPANPFLQQQIGRRVDRFRENLPIQEGLEERIDWGRFRPEDGHWDYHEQARALREQRMRARDAINLRDYNDHAGVPGPRPPINRAGGVDTPIDQVRLQAGERRNRLFPALGNTRFGDGQPPSVLGERDAQGTHPLQMAVRNTPQDAAGEPAPPNYNDELGRRRRPSGH
ncbi:uncharacterized protein KY384_007688 [Bacidia gigantensis]|uniref:uncharacterized protein n=1 Tax=Bacidia gigantensis TaxID=2732470 RepID=UPI001D056274|nr:uncharacterized protein KY384_007688 [Bacidia gigantensis]KAG8527536.1 hypothetical protein KY384_007688 [Bacidia gigantensis]